MAEIIDFKTALQHKKVAIKKALTAPADPLEAPFTAAESKQVETFDSNIERVFDKIEEVASAVTPFTESRVEACLDELFLELFTGIEERDFDNSAMTETLISKLDEIQQNK